MGKRFNNWQEAYEHYFSKPTDPEYRRVYSRPIEVPSSDYQQEFDIALREAIYDRFVYPGIHNMAGADGESLHPAFREEESLLIKLFKYQRHTGEEETVASVASPDLQQKESFWRAALDANAKTIISLAHFVEECRRENPEKELSLQALLHDEDAMITVFLYYPAGVYYIATAAPDMFHINGPMAELILDRNFYNIQQFNLDAGNQEELNAYQEWVEKAWDALPQKSQIYKRWPMEYRLPSRQEFLTLLKEPFKQSAKVLFNSTQTLIQELETFISDTKQKQSNMSGRIFSFFATKPGDTLKAATVLLQHLNNNNEISKKSAPDLSNYLEMLSRTTLKNSIEKWQQSKQNMFSSTAEAPEQKMPRSH